MTLNPWKHIRDLKEQLAEAKRDIVIMQGQFYNVEKIAYLRAEEAFMEKTRSLVMLNEHLTQQLTASRQVSPTVTMPWSDSPVSTFYQSGQSWEDNVFYTFTNKDA